MASTWRRAAALIISCAICLVTGPGHSATLLPLRRCSQNASALGLGQPATRVADMIQHRSKIPQSAIKIYQAHLDSVLDDDAKSICQGCDAKRFDTVRDSIKHP